jgi:uncharacterized BrkB/YihY/UPF0761 family membrane protein
VDPQSADPARATAAGLPGLVERVVAWVDSTQRRHSVLGFPYAVVKKYGDDAAGKHAALITYYGFLSVFPILLLTVVLVTNVLAGNQQLREDVIANIVPAEFQETVDNALLSLPTGGLPLVVGVVGLLFSASGIVFSVYDTLNHLAAVPHRERFDMVPRYLRGFAMVAVLLVSALSVGALAVITAEVPDVGGAPRVVTIVGLYAIAFVLLVAAPKLLIARATPMRAIWPAAVIGALVVGTLLLVLGPILARFIARSGPVYGSFATIVGLFALLYLVSQTLLYAAEIAVVGRARLWPRALDASRPTPADRRALTLLARIEARIAPEQITVSFGPPADDTAAPPGEEETC